MFPQPSRTGISASLLQSWHLNPRRFDPVAIMTMAIGIVVMTALMIMF